MEEDIRLHRDTGTKTSARIEQRLEAAIEKASKRIKYDAAHDNEIIRALSVVEEFIKKKKRVCYGGTAMNALLPDSKKFYDPEFDLPDYDFYTPDPDGDVEDLVSILNKEGFKDVYHKMGMHEGTRKILVNYVPVADISRIDPQTFAVVFRRSIVKGGMHYMDENILRMMMYLELSRPKGEVDRWPKVFDRLQLINSLFPIRGCTRSKVTQPLVPIGIRTKIIDYIIEWKRILCNGPIIALYTQGIRKGKSVFHIGEGGPPVFTSPDPKVDASTLKREIGDVSIQLFRHKAHGEIVPERIELRKSGKTLCVIIEEIACHSYTAFPTSDAKQIYIGSLEFLITLYLSLSIFTANADDILGKNILCQVKEFIRLSKENSLSRTSQFEPFAIQCRGHQVGYASLLRAKVQRIQKEKNATRSIKKSAPRHTKKTRATK